MIMAFSPDPGTEEVANPSRRPQLAAWIGLLFALAVCVIAVLMVLAPFFSVILLAVVASGLIRPSYRRLVTALKGRRPAAAILICGMLLVVLLVPLYIIAQEVSQEALGIYEMSTTQLTEGRLREMLEQRQDRIEQANRFLEPFGLTLTVDRAYDLLATLGVRIGGFFYKSGVSLAKGRVRFGVGFICWGLSLYYVLVVGGEWGPWSESTMPLRGGEQHLGADRVGGMAAGVAS